MQVGLAEVLASLRAQRGVDLRGYVVDVLERRLQERLTSTKTPSMAAYLERLEHDGDEIDQLITAFHVGTTGFFRDPQTFAALEAIVLPKLASPQPLRAWVPGCSTGEDAWSLAACFEVTLADSSAVIGSDIDDDRLAKADRGQYGIRHLPAIDEAHRRCFVVGAETIEPIEYLRLRTRFVHHDIVSGPLAPQEAIVASFHLIMVRNVLLYFKADARREALARLVRTLQPGGALVVGGTETVSHPLLMPWPKTPTEARIYQRVPA